MGTKAASSGKSAAPKKSVAVQSAKEAQIKKKAAKTFSHKHKRKHKSAAARKLALLDAAAPQDVDCDDGRFVFD
jgi:hypothetical protein